eukprot:g76865.t1
MEEDEDSLGRESDDQEVEVKFTTLRPPPQTPIVRKRKNRPVGIHTLAGGKEITPNPAHPPADQPSKAAVCGRRGMHNPGTMCWLIATKQALASIQDLPQILLSWTRRQRPIRQGTPQHTLYLISNTLDALAPRGEQTTRTPLQVRWLRDQTTLSNLHQ